MILDDLDSRPGSSTSLLRSIVGMYLRELGGWIAAPALIELMGAVGVAAPVTRTTIVRVKQKGLLVAEARDGVAGLRLGPGAERMLARGDRRIYHPRMMAHGDRWCLASVSVPEAERALRHQLRRRLQGIGCGNVSLGLWICPAFLVDEVVEILEELDLRRRATVFVTDTPDVGGDLPAAVARWWDLPYLRSLHDAFLDAHRADVAPVSGEQAFVTYVRAVDSWRLIPYVDPGLPADLLPADWPGRESTELFLTLRRRHGAAAGEHVAAVVGRWLPDAARLRSVGDQGQSVVG
ncbi:PaaX family transcriptional regulator [Pseudonocardia sp. CA-107938]|uniref:PaaX family transcriptional regulator n=1 Tax=Pseudonocardia sp. CA-107938 TaxID=3240021 RepID=UPI003D929152